METGQQFIVNRKTKRMEEKRKKKKERKKKKCKKVEEMKILATIAKKISIEDH